MNPAHDHQPLILAERDQPFWGFAEILLVAALFLPAVWVGSLAVQKAFGFSGTTDMPGSALVTAEFIGYALILLVLKILFARYGRPLFESLGWVAFRLRPLTLVAIGFSLALLVVLLGNILQIPNTETPFDKLLDDPVSRIVIAAFGITLGPVIEELLFRGFLQPVLTNSFGVFPGILATSVLFGTMHLIQNANIWQSGLLITLVGFVLGVIRHVSGSTRASTITHISYNSLPFLAVMLAGNPSHPH